MSAANTQRRSLPPPRSCRIIRQAFVRGIGVIYLIAIVSLWTQIQGLVGSHGLLPVRHYLDLVRQLFPHDFVRQNPSLVWLNASDSFLNFLCGAGVVLSLAVIAGILQAPALALLWVIYLSLSVAGQEFLNFQWDALLLEAGLLTVFFAPTQLLPRLSRQREPSHIVLWLIRWLLFRLMFLSGLVKLLSGDSCWRDGSAMNYHYLTQPLPTWTSYWVYQLPAVFQWFSVWIMFGIEVLSPFMIFAGDLIELPSTREISNTGRRSRQAAFVFLMSLQLLITATGNFGFFNLLAMLLCLTLLDDEVIPGWLRRWLLAGAASAHVRAVKDKAGRSGAASSGGAVSLEYAGGPESSHSIFRRRWQAILKQPARDWCRLIAASLFAAVIVFLTTLSGIEECIRTVSYGTSLPGALQAVVDWVGPLRSTNGYGLFRVMTRERNEIVIEGSDDGAKWKAYEFKYKPGDPFRRPGFCTPHMPRLDWQMWFGVFGRAEQNRWFIPLLKRLLAGEPHVLALLDENPFPDHPPKYIRAVRYNYRFAPVSAEGRWWNRSHTEGYFPPVTLTQMKDGFPEPDVDSP